MDMDIFKKGVEDAIRSFTDNIGKNVKGMRTGINKQQEDIDKIKANNVKVPPIVIKDLNIYLFQLQNKFPAHIYRYLSASNKHL